jgi:hypothetical protein
MDRRCEQAGQKALKERRQKEVTRRAKGGKPRNPIADAGGLALCQDGMHAPPNSRGKCPRCKKKLGGVELADAGMIGLLGMFVGAMVHGYREARGTQAHMPAFDPMVNAEYFDLGVMPPPAIDWRGVFGFEARSMPEVAEVKRRYREAAVHHHPDRGGDPEKFKTITAARDAALKELGA